MMQIAQQGWEATAVKGYRDPEAAFGVSDASRCQDQARSINAGKAEAPSDPSHDCVWR